MCGRLKLTHPDHLLQEFHLPPQFKSYLREGTQIIPRQKVPTLYSKEGRLRGTASLWGVRGNQGKFIYNARGESSDSFFWEYAFQNNRALILCDGFYETKGEKTYLFELPDQQPFGLAAVMYPVGLLWTSAVVTCPAFGNVAPIHHRQPLPLSPEQVDIWLYEGGDTWQHLLAPSHPPFVVTQV